MDPQVRSRLGSLGRELSPEMMTATQALFAERIAAGPQASCRVSVDEIYGPDPRHRLDVFSPPESGVEQRPVLIFVHGGGFVRGDKSAPGSPFYANIGRWAATQDMVGVVMTYRLAPGFPWPAGPQDIARAVEWAAGHIAAFGGDPLRMVLMGQSAGAVHAASYVAFPEFHGAGGSGLAGAILVSGLYDLASAEPNMFQRAYFGDDPGVWPDRSSLPGLLATDLPLLFSVSEFDAEDFQRQAAQLASAWLTAKGEAPRLLRLAGHNHLSPVLELGLPDATLAPEILGFVEATGAALPAAAFQA